MDAAAAAGEMRKRSIDRDESQFPHPVPLSFCRDRVSTNVIFPMFGYGDISGVIITSSCKGTFAAIVS